MTPLVPHPTQPQNGAIDAGHEPDSGLDFGAQDDSNWMWIGADTPGAPVVPGDFDAVFKPRLAAMRMPVVRKFIDVSSGSGGGTSAINDTRSNAMLAPLLDFYDFHEYQGNAAGIDGVAQNSMAKVAAAVTPTGKQAWLTEFGLLSTGVADWQAIALFAITGVNKGLAVLMPVEPV